jgi:MFS family permease
MGLFLSVGAYVNIQFNSYLFQMGGLSPREIGTVAALGSLAALFSPLLAGWWTDRWGHPRAVLAVYLVTGAGALAILPRLRGLAVLAPSFFLIQFALSPISPLCTSLVLSRTPSRHGAFLAMRAMGTLGFFLVSVWLTSHLESIGLEGAYRIMALLLLASVPVYLGLRRGTARAHRPGMELRAALAYLWNPRLRSVYFGCGLGYFCNALGVTVLGNYVTGPLGGSPRDIARAWEVATGFEMAFLVLSIPFVRRFGLKNFVLLGLAGTSLRWALAAWAPGFQLFLISQTLHGLMVAGVFTGQSLLLARLLPADRLASGSAAAALVNGGIMSVAGSALSGWIWEMAGLRAVCWTTSGVAAVAMVYFWHFGPDPEAA